jgi:Rhodopirellula transposase DDE domain
VEQVVRVVPALDLGEPCVLGRAVGRADAVLVELDHGVDVAADAVGEWLQGVPERPYPVALGADADRLLITADSGGANGNRWRTWKIELAALAECCSTSTSPTRWTRASRSGEDPDHVGARKRHRLTWEGLPGHPAVKLAPSRAARGLQAVA